MMPMTVLMVAALALGATADAREAERQVQTVVVVVGAAGTREYATQFAEWEDLWRQACAKGNIRYVAVSPDENADASDRTRVQAVLAEAAEETSTALWLVLIGHGTYDGRTARFNLRGPDISADDLAGWLEPVKRPIAIINTTSSSAPFLKRLSAPGRVIITATKSGFEQNYARFGQFLAEAVVRPQADLDKDGQTSLLEAFLTASHRVAEFYAAAGRLATEHALLDDNGDTLGTPADWFRGIRPVQKASDDASLDGYRAHQFHLLYSDTEAQMPPALRARRDQLELEVMNLRDAKAASPEDEYFARLEALLYEIAQLYEENEGRP
jgi:hypothetical protein